MSVTSLSIYIVAINLLAFIIFGYDKKQSVEGGWRVSEKNLFTLVLIGGTVGILLGQKAFRHKTRKASFNITLAIILVAQALIISTTLD